MLRRSLLFALALSLFALPCFADDLPYLVRDLPGVTTQSSVQHVNPYWTTVGDTTWFTATNASKRLEVWKTNGRADGTVRVTDYATQGIEPSGMFYGVINDKLIFSGTDKQSQGLFALSMNGGAPVRIANVARSQGKGGILFHGRLYFVAWYVYGNAPLLWRTDGTAAGTVIVRFGQDFETFDSALFEIWVAGDVMYYVGTSASGRGVHSTDGTSATLLLPMTALQTNNDVRSAGELGSRWLFFARPFLWATDGTPEGTQKIFEAPRNVVGTLGGKIFFDDLQGHIFSTDGTAAGTTQVDFLASFPEYHGVLARLSTSSKLFFTASKGAGLVLFSTEGTAATTQKIIPGNPLNAFVFKDLYYFGLDTEAYGIELWSSDGTSAGTQLLADIAPGASEDGYYPYGYALRDDGVVFTGCRADSGCEPWITNGTIDGTYRIANALEDKAVHGSSPFSLAAWRDGVFFAARPPVGISFGRSDGSSLGTWTTKAPEIGPVFFSVAANGTHFLTCDRSFGLPAIVVSDGTPSHTFPLFRSRVISPPQRFRDGVIWSGEGNAIYVSDGTVEGTHTVPPSLPAFPDAKVWSFGDEAWVTRSNQIWRMNGIIATRLPDVPEEGDVRDVVTMGNLVIFAQNQSLWRANRDGSDMRKIAATPATVDRLLAGEHQMFFMSGPLLYRSDGTFEGTIALPLKGSVIQKYMVMHGDALVFVDLDAEGYYAVTRTDGTVAGTIELFRATRKNVNYFPNVAVRGNTIYFAGYDEAHGFEPWVSDGTVAGSHMLADLNAGFYYSDPLEFTAAGDRVFFTATTPEHGRELWAIGGDAPPSRRHSVR